MSIITVIIVIMRLQVYAVLKKLSAQIVRNVSNIVSTVRKTVVSTMLIVLIVINATNTAGAVMGIMVIATVKFVSTAEGAVRLAMITDRVYAARICYAHAIPNVTETRAAVTIRTAMKIVIVL